MKHKSDELWKALTEIEDSYIQSAQEFRSQIERTENRDQRALFGRGGRRAAFRRFAGRGVAAAAALAILVTGTVYGGTRLMRQRHITGYDSVEKLVSEQKTESETMLAVSGGVFDETLYQGQGKAECWLGKR